MLIREQLQEAEGAVNAERELRELDKEKEALARQHLQATMHGTPSQLACSLQNATSNDGISCLLASKCTSNDGISCLLASKCTSNDGI